MAGEGRILQVAREEKKWSYRDAEEVTKISVRYIQALEGENYGVLPGTTYAKGYLRTYAKHLGLNSDEIIALFNDSVEPEPKPVYAHPKPVIKVSPSWFRPLLIGGMAVLAIVLVIVIASWNRAGNKPANSADLPTLPTAPTAPQTDSAAPVSNADLPPISVDQAESPTNNPTDLPADITENAAQNEPDILPEEIPRDLGGVNPAPSSSVPSEDGLTAVLTFSQDCWMLIRVDNESEFQELYPAGTTREIKASSKIEFVSVGNAGGLSVTLNGTTLPSFADDGKVVNNIVLTKDTLIN